MDRVRYLSSHGEYRVGEKVPMPPRKLDIRPNAPIDNRPSFQPSRNAK